jgi:SH3-like domain-containing protein
LPDLRRRRALSRYGRAIAGAASALVLQIAAAQLPAAAADEDVGLKVPRFVSLHSDKVNLRTGPGRQYPIDWVLTRKDMPVEVIAQFEHWRRVRGWDGTVGWVQEHMLTGKRYAVVAKGGVRAIYREPDGTSGLVAKAEPGVVARLVECRGPWCRIETDDVTGWIRRTELWGVYPDESLP